MPYWQVDSSLPTTHSPPHPSRKDMMTITTEDTAYDALHARMIETIEADAPHLAVVTQTAPQTSAALSCSSVPTLAATMLTRPTSSPATGSRKSGPPPASTPSTFHTSPGRTARS